MTTRLGGCDPWLAIGLGICRLAAHGRDGKKVRREGPWRYQPETLEIVLRQEQGQLSPPRLCPWAKSRQSHGQKVQAVNLQKDHLEGRQYRTTVKFVLRQMGKVLTKGQPVPNRKTIFRYMIKHKQDPVRL